MNMRTKKNSCHFCKEKGKINISPVPESEKYIMCPVCYGTNYIPNQYFQEADEQYHPYTHELPSMNDSHVNY